MIVDILYYRIYDGNGTHREVFCGAVGYFFTFILLIFLFFGPFISWM
jgi:hypothetical protein